MKSSSTNLEKKRDSGTKDYLNHQFKDLVRRSIKRNCIKFEFVISAARGEIRFDQIKQWLTNHIEPGNYPQHSV